MIRLVYNAHYTTLIFGIHTQEWSRVLVSGFLIILLILGDVCVPGHGGQGVRHGPQVAVAGAQVAVSAAEGRLLHQRLPSPSGAGAGAGGVSGVTGEQTGEIIAGQRAGHHPA